MSLLLKIWQAMAYAVSGVTQRYGSYNVTTNGMLIAEGGDFNSSESTSFSLPMLADNACEGITTKKECTKSDSNCEWDTGLCIFLNYVMSRYMFLLT